MQLDPQMKALLDQLAAGGGKPFHFGTPQEARAGINALNRTRQELANMLEGLEFPAPGAAR